MTDNRVAITLPPDGRWLPYAQDCLARYGGMVGFTPRLEEIFSSSVLEACEELFAAAARAGVSEAVRLRLDCKGGAVVADIEYSARIPLNPHRTEDYEVPDAPGPDVPDMNEPNMDVLWLHLIKRRMDRVRFLVRGKRHVLRMIKYRREAGKEKQAWIMAVVPELRQGLILHLDDPEAAHPSSVLQATGTGVLRLGPSETFVVRQMDGQRAFHDIYMAHIDELGLVSPGALTKLYEKLESMGMLAGTGQEAARTRLGRLVRKAVNPNFSIPRADSVVASAHARTRLLFTRPGAWLLLLAGLSGLIPAWTHLPRFAEVVAGLEEQILAHPWMVAPVYALFLVHVVLHELGHGVTCKHFGGRVPRLGIMFYLASFIFYCDTTAAWNFPGKRQRILVSLGGPMVSLAVLAAGLWAAGALAGTGSPWESVFVAFDLLVLFGLAMNFNPFIKMDAYYMLLDLTGIPNLREKSFRFLEDRLLGGLGLGSAKAEEITPRERRIFWWYGLLGAVGTALFMILPLARLGLMLHARSASGGRLFLVVCVGALLAVRLANAAFRKVKAVRYREYTLQ